MKILISESQYKRIIDKELDEGGPPLSQDEVIKTLKKIFRKEDYDYSKLKYVNNYTPLEIICNKEDDNNEELKIKKHGPFYKPYNYMYLRGIGCDKCIKSKKREQFIRDAEKVHGKGTYDYSRVVFYTDKTKVNIICHKKDEDGEEHGSFPQSPDNHLKGNGCPICGRLKRSVTKSSNTKEFIKRAEKLWGKGRYDYKNVNYIDAKTDVTIICNKKYSNGEKHGPFPQSPYSHLKKHEGCKECIRLNRTRTSEQFVKEAEDVHGVGRYDYSKVDYHNVDSKVIIICPQLYSNGKKHGEFLQRPSTHLAGSGCPFCKESKGEKSLQEILDKKGIKNEREKTFDDCKSKFKQRDGKIYRVCRKLKFDFYLPNKNVLIEFDGDYHFRVINTKEDYRNQIVNDRLKNEFVRNHPNLRLIRIAIGDRDNLKEELENGLRSTDKIYLSKRYPKNLGWRSNMKIKFDGEVY